jgi:hypothetical protein
MTVDFTKEELEHSAAELVAAATDVTYTCLDCGRVREQMPDFALLQGDVRVGVLEVTSSRPQDRAGFTAALREHPIIVPNSRLFWNLAMRINCDVRELGKTLPDLLAKVERHMPSGSMFEVHHPTGYPWTRRPVPAEINESLYQAGVQFVVSQPAHHGLPPGAVLVRPPGVGGFIGPNLVTQDVAQVLTCPDNLVKLEAAEAGQRAELFVWLIDTMGSLAMRTTLTDPDFPGGYPTDGPTLPSIATGVWVATLPSVAAPFARVLWYSDGGVWQPREIPSIGT